MLKHVFKMECAACVVTTVWNTFTRAGVETTMRAAKRKPAAEHRRHQGQKRAFLPLTDAATRPPSMKSFPTSATLHHFQMNVLLLSALVLFSVNSTVDVCVCWYLWIRSTLPTVWHFVFVEHSQRPANLKKLGTLAGLALLLVRSSSLRPLFLDVGCSFRSLLRSLLLSFFPL